MNDIIYMGLPSHHYFSIEHSETFNSYLHKRLNNSFDSLEEVDINEENPLHLFSDQDQQQNNFLYQQENAKVKH